MKIIPLSEGSFTVDASKKFIPFDHSRDNIKDRPAGSLLVEVQPFAVITSKDILESAPRLLITEANTKVERTSKHNAANPLNHFTFFGITVVGKNLKS